MDSSLCQGTVVVVASTVVVDHKLFRLYIFFNFSFNFIVDVIGVTAVFAQSFEIG